MKKLLVSIAVVLFLVCTADAAQPKISPDRINTSQPFPSILMDEGENITLDGGYINFEEGLLSPNFTTSDADIYIKLKGSKYIAYHDTGEIIYYGTSAATSMESAITALATGGGVISLDTDMTTASSIDVSEDDIFINGNNHKITSGAGCSNGIIFIDPVGLNKSLNGIIISDLALACNGVAGYGIRITGHRGVIQSGYHQFRNVKVTSPVNAGFCFNNTVLTRLTDCETVYAKYGILLEEACIQFWINNYHSDADKYGIRIGYTDPAPHSRNEGILITDPYITGSTENGIYINGVLFAKIEGGIIDYIDRDCVKILGNVSEVYIQKCYISGAGQTEISYNGVKIAPTAYTVSDINILDSTIAINTYDGISCTKVNRLLVRGCTFWSNGLLASGGGGDIVISNTNNSIITGNILASSIPTNSLNVYSSCNKTLVALNNYRKAMTIADTTNVTANNIIYDAT